MYSKASYNIFGAFYKSVHVNMSKIYIESIVTFALENTMNICA
jgi:hypothetical protein